MKHKILLSACVLMVVAAGVLALQAHHRYSAHQTLVRATAITNQVKQDLALQKQAQANATKLKEVQAQIVQMQTQCESGVKDYNLLTTLQKSKAVLPDCTLHGVVSM